MVWCSSWTVCEESYVKAPMSQLSSSLLFLETNASFCLMTFEGLVGYDDIFKTVLHTLQDLTHFSEGKGKCRFLLILRSLL